MIYFCADDYGLSKESCTRIEKCVNDGVLNKISVLPNGIVPEFKERLINKNVQLSLHLNLVEGHSLSAPAEIPLLVSPEGFFKHSFIGLCLLAFSPKRKTFAKQLRSELQQQLRFWKTHIGSETPFFIDSHQHVIMIPLIFKTLLRVIREENITVSHLRLPSEPLLPYLLTPSLYLTYKPANIIKQWLLNFFSFFNKRILKKHNISYSCFMGILFSGKMDEARISKVLPHYLRYIEKHNQTLEMCFHPGYFEQGEKLMDGSQKGFDKFYYSSGRVDEFHTLLNLRTQIKDMKEGHHLALH